MKEILSVKDVASLCAVASSTVQYWEKCGYIKSFKTLGGHRRFEKQSVVDLLEKRGRLANEKRTEQRFNVNFPATASLATSDETTLSSKGRLSDISASGFSIEIEPFNVPEKDISDLMANHFPLKIETNAELPIIKSPIVGRIRNFSLKEGLLRIGLSFN